MDPHHLAVHRFQQFGGSAELTQTCKGRIGYVCRIVRSPFIQLQAAQEIQPYRRHTAMASYRALL